MHHFLSTGLPKKIADQITLGLKSSDFDVTNISIFDNKVIDLTQYDIVGIGSPTYFFRPPFLMMDFVRNLKGLENKSFFVFILYGTIQGDSGNWIRKELINKGAKDLGYFKTYGPDYWLGYIKRGFMFSNLSPTVQELQSAEIFGKTISIRFTDKSRKTEIFDPSAPFMYRLEKFLVSRPFAKNIYSKTFRVNKNCDNCGICVKKCPISNISQDDGKLKWRSNCLLCATCELSCPKDAIHCAFDWVIFSPFMAYNINHAKRKIPFVNVTHKNGKTILI
ncbi:MAG TPA: EFR1 family ferrodoxin [Amoebophilaceae bacterium]|nr:EFR1 family ferrodoxin [Amoebophilaceae bacterium]HLP72822.1 EFR1 family ferrodoxin [Bacteroidales bacterium]